MHTELVSMYLSNVNTAILTSDIIQIGIPTLKLRHTHDDFFLYKLHFNLLSSHSIAYPLPIVVL